MMWSIADRLRTAADYADRQGMYDLLHGLADELDAEEQARHQSSLPASAFSGEHDTEGADQRVQAAAPSVIPDGINPCPANMCMGLTNCNGLACTAPQHPVSA